MIGPPASTLGRKPFGRVLPQQSFEQVLSQKVELLEPGNLIECLLRTANGLDGVDVGFGLVGQSPEEQLEHDHSEAPEVDWNAEA